MSLKALGWKSQGMKRTSFWPMPQEGEAKVSVLAAEVRVSQEQGGKPVGLSPKGGVDSGNVHRFKWRLSNHLEESSGGLLHV